MTTHPAISIGERRQLRSALRESDVAPRLRAVLERASGSSHGRPRHRTFRVLDMKYEPGARCTILYALDGRMVLGVLAWGDGPRQTDENAARIEPMGLQLYPFPHDPAMPGLPAAMWPKAMAAVLARVLPECGEGWRVLRCRVAPVRYRPMRRCTLRIDAELHRHTGKVRHLTLYGKVYQDVMKASYAVLPLRRLAEGGRLEAVDVSAAVAFVPDIPMVLQEPLAGVPLDLFLRSRGRSPGEVGERAQIGVIRAAEAMVGLHGSGATHPRRRSATAVRRLLLRGRAIGLVDPELGDRMTSLASALSLSLEPLSLERSRVTMIHGDCKPSQFLLNGDRIGLLDFDHSGMADPASDVGTFLASLRQIACVASRRRSQAPQLPALLDLERLFLHRYLDIAEADPGLPERATWYQAFALLRKAQRAFARSTSSPVPMRLVAHAKASLSAGLSEDLTEGSWAKIP